jgi:2-polyprenyl-3-methyl-5-hydroxy-6-metoxy-1,4-benzoquinol methylase
MPQPYNSKPPSKIITPQERIRMIDEAAYYRAEKQGFLVNPQENWIAAEKEVDARLAADGIVVRAN